MRRVLVAALALASLGAQAANPSASAATDASVCDLDASTLELFGGVLTTSRDAPWANRLARRRLGDWVVANCRAQQRLMLSSPTRAGYDIVRLDELAKLLCLGAGIERTASVVVDGAGQSVTGLQWRCTIVSTERLANAVASDRAQLGDEQVLAQMQAASTAAGTPAASAAAATAASATTAAAPAPRQVGRMPMSPDAPPLWRALNGGR